jgi:type IX secretion system PorP/SprF family membrane protein
MALKKVCYILITTCFISAYAFGQEVLLSQPFSVSQYQNPAAVGGSESNNRFQANYKSQMIDGNNLYKTILIGYDTRLNHEDNGSKNYLGLGGSLISDQVMWGIMQNNYLTINLAYHIYLDEKLNSNLSLGIGTTLTQTSLDKSKLRFNDQYDYRALLMYPTLENLKPYPTAFTANAGALYTRHTANSFIQTGFMTYLYAKPNVTYSPFNKAEDIRFRAFVNTEFPLIDDKSVLLYFNYLNRTSLTQYYMGAMVGMPVIKDQDELFKMYVGCFYRVNDAFVPTLSFISKNNTVGFSYDVYGNKLSGADLRQNGFEISYARKFGFIRKDRYRTIFN